TSRFSRFPTEIAQGALPVLVVSLVSFTGPACRRERSFRGRCRLRDLSDLGEQATDIGRELVPGSHLFTRPPFALRLGSSLGQVGLLEPGQNLVGDIPSVGRLGGFDAAGEELAVGLHPDPGLLAQTGAGGGTGRGIGTPAATGQRRRPGGVETAIALRRIG